jgi:NADPH:quinone reductase-like Zn-dependent oxidoreductase
MCRGAVPKVFNRVFDLGQAQKGERILIIGAAGAVGGCAVQLAKDLGAYIYAVDLPEKADFARTLGPDCFIDRTFPLDEAQFALDYRMKSTHPGKVVLKVR